MKNRIAEYLPTAWFRRPRQTAEGLAGNNSLQTWTEPVENFVSKNPAAALAVAFAAGVAIAWWLKRR
jgi:hypothetical protein